MDHLYKEQSKTDWRTTHLQPRQPNIQPQSYISQLFIRNQYNNNRLHEYATNFNTTQSLDTSFVQPPIKTPYLP